MSMGSLCATHVLYRLQYVCEAVAQSAPRQEIVTDMKEVAMKLLKKYCMHNKGQYPEVMCDVCVNVAFGFHVCK